MLHLLKRHPFSVNAFFRQSLVLTYAFPTDVLSRCFLPACFRHLRRLWLSCDRHGADATAASEFSARCAGVRFFLSGYRIFARLAKSAGSLRGLRILRSDTNHRWMVRAGNLLTHYQYRLCHAELNERPGEIEWNVRTPQQEADLRVIAHVADEPSLPPAGSPFLNLKDARRFAGPLPYTFDYEPETHSIIRIQGVRREWHPKPVAVEVLQNTFLRRQPFRRATPILANAFQVHDVPYAWKRGIRTPLEST